MSESVTEKDPPPFRVLAQDLFYTFAVMRILLEAFRLKLSLRLNQIRIRVSAPRAEKCERTSHDWFEFLLLRLVEKVARILLMTNHMAQQSKIKECEITLDTHSKPL